MHHYTVYFVWKLLYMFRVVPPPTIRSANNCSYSIWYLSHRYSMCRYRGRVGTGLSVLWVAYATDSGVHPASCLMDTRGLSQWVTWPIVKLTAHLHPMPRLRMCGAISLPSTCLYDMHRNFNCVFVHKKAFIWQTKAQRWYIHTYTTDYWNCNWQNNAEQFM